MLTCIPQTWAEHMWQLCLVQVWGEGVSCIVADSADELKAGMLGKASAWLSFRMLA